MEADLYPNWIWKGKVTALGWPVPSWALAQRLRGQVWLQHVFPSLTWAALPQLPPSNQFSAHIAANEAPASPIPVWGWSELELLSGDCNPDTHSCMQIQTCVATIRILWLDPSLKCTILIYFDYLKIFNQISWMHELVPFLAAHSTRMNGGIYSVSLTFIKRQKHGQNQLFHPSSPPLWVHLTPAHAILLQR